MSFASKGSFGCAPPTGTPTQRSTSVVSSCLNSIAVSVIPSSPLSYQFESRPTVRGAARRRKHECRYRRRRGRSGDRSGASEQLGERRIVLLNLFEARPVVEEPPFTPRLDQPSRVQQLRVVGDRGLRQREMPVELGASHL